MKRKKSKKRKSVVKKRKRIKKTTKPYNTNVNIPKLKNRKLNNELPFKLRKVKDPIVKENLKRVPSRIIKIFGAAYQNVLEKIVNLIFNCPVRFKYEKTAFAIELRDLCVYTYELELLIKHVMNGESFRDANDYKSTMVAANFDKTELLNNTVVSFAINKLKIETIHNSDKLLSDFTEKSKLVLKESKEFLKDLKKTIEYRVFAIKNFNRMIEDFFRSTQNWFFSRQIGERLKELGFNTLPNGTTDILKKAINFIEKTKRGYQKYNVHRINYCIKIVCNILLKINKTGWGIRSIIFGSSHKTQKIPNSVDKLVDYIVIIPLRQEYYKFKKEIILKKNNIFSTNMVDNNKNMVYKLNTKTEIIFFNRWSYFEYKNCTTGIPGSKMWKDFKKYVESNSITIGKKEHIITTTIDQNNSYTRKQAMINLRFLKLKKPKGRTFIFHENINLDDSDGMYKLEKIEEQ